ncbi:unnamed protein product [Candida verbasci]|uniref:UBX domain-containing protein 1 n=1 Tax=Candida verbasci TaxID=1227364 RepID=A0A9W4X802_9ASCO|nr:unnamed protein product [Candida verbasci]
MSDRVAEFIQITNSTKYLAEQYLQRNNNDLVEAVEDFYANNGHESKKPRKSGVNTFRDLNDDDESEDDKTNTNFFTGGEKSGLQVEDPNKDRDQNIIEQIFQKAKEQMQQPDDRPSARNQEKPMKFSGTGFKLGDGQVESEVIEDPDRPNFKPTKVNREITFWRQGFTVGDGPLHRYDDPRNATILQELNQGRVPMSILDVEFGQDVDVSVFKKTDEDWTPPKRKLGGYHGPGQRLGSPVPGEPIVTEKVEKSENKPNESDGDTLVQIRFANGKRITQKFNSTDTIASVYKFVRNHENNVGGREFILSHAIPVKPIEEDDTTVGDAKLKNAVIVQRWK